MWYRAFVLVRTTLDINFIRPELPKHELQIGTFLRDISQMCDPHNHLIKSKRYLSTRIGVPLLIPAQSLKQLFLFDYSKTAFPPQAQSNEEYLQTRRGRRRRDPKQSVTTKVKWK